MNAPFSITTSIPAEVHRAVMRERANPFERLVMKGSVLVAFLFISAMLFGLV